MKFRQIVPIIVPVVSLSALIVSGFFLFRISTGAALVPFAKAHKQGSIFFVGEHKVGINQPFTLQIKVDTNGQMVNAAGLQLRFDPARVQINEIDTLNSFCQYYPEKKFDNKQGLVSLACGAPHPGIKGENELIEMKITPLVVGSTTFYISNSSKLLLSDGKGTNILSDYPNWEVQIVTRL